MLHQTSADKAEERRIAQQLAKSWRCEAMEYPSLCPVDWYMKRDDRLCALVEIKRKFRTFAKHPTIGLDGNKLLPLLNASMAFNAPGLYVVRCDDGLYMVSARALLGLTAIVNGRRDRHDDKNDVEPYIPIPLRLFKPVKL